MPQKLLALGYNQYATTVSKLVKNWLRFVEKTLWISIKITQAQFKPSSQETLQKSYILG